MTHAEAIAIRRDAAVRLEHAIARLGHYGPDGWMQCGQDDADAVYLLQHSKWSLEAMDSPASNRFWDAERSGYETMLASLTLEPESDMEMERRKR